MNSRLLFIHALSSLHPGTGQSVGAIDLAIAREKSTGVPFVPGSSIKGVLRDRSAANGGSNGMVTKIFGPAPQEDLEHGGSVSFGDARLLFLPVRSLAGTFAYVTSPFLLQRALRDALAARLQRFPPNGPGVLDRCFVGEDSMLCLENRVIFEDLDFIREQRPEIGQVAAALGELIFGEGGEDLLRQRLCIVHDDVMSFFLEQATEVRARIRLDEETKIVAKGALWYEESLPAETILLSFVMAFPPKAVRLSATEVLAYVEGLSHQGPIQLGGNATVGQGLCQLRLAGGAS